MDINNLKQDLFNELETIASQVGVAKAFELKLGLLQAMNVNQIAAPAEVEYDVKVDNTEVINKLDNLVQAMNLLANTVQAVENKVEELSNKVNAIDINPVAQMDVTPLIEAINNNNSYGVEFEKLNAKLDNLNMPQELQQVSVEVAPKTFAEMKADFEEAMCQTVSDEAFQEFLDLQARREAGEDIKYWIPDASGHVPTPEGCIVPLWIQESPLYAHLFVEKDEGEVELVVEEQDDLAKTQEELNKIEAEEIVVEDMEDEEQEPVVIENEDGEEVDVTEEYVFIRNLCPDMTDGEALDVTRDWVDFATDVEVFNRFEGVANVNQEVVLGKVYATFYLANYGDDEFIGFINRFADNIEMDPRGFEVYKDEELQIEFLNENNISAFVNFVNDYLAEEE